MTFTSVMPNLYTADIDRAAAFYLDRLGATQTYRYPAQGPARHLEFQLGGVMIALTGRHIAEGEGLPAPTAGHPLELVVWCESVDDAVAALRGAGTPVLVEPYDHVAGHRRAYVTDPDGNWIALVS